MNTQPPWRTRALLLAIVALTCAAVFVACGGGSSPAAAGSGSGTTPPTDPTEPANPTDVLTYKYDLARTGQNLTETILTVANVNSASFGLQRVLATDGKVDAQPLYLANLTVQGAAHNVVYVATENDSVYAFDVNSGAALWHTSVLPSGETASDLPPYSCDQVAPLIGITSTPVIDRSAGANGTIYLVAMSKSSSGEYHQRLHALDVTTGAELAGSAADISATYPVLGGTTTFDPAQYEERAALLLSQGVIYTSWTSHCDVAPYSGWVIGFNQQTLARTAVLNVAPNSGGSGPAIWMSGGGPAADSAGNVYLLTANGAFETALDANGFPNQQDYGNSFLRLSGAAGTLAVADYFTMYNVTSESAADQDLGSGGILLLPDATDASGTVRQLAVGAGKDGALYVVERGAMGKFNASGNSNWQYLAGALDGGIWSTPAYFNGTLYYGPVGGTLRAFRMSQARFAATPSSVSAHSFPYPGTAPSVSANGSGDAIVWAHENSSPAVLHAYDAGNLAHELYNSSQASNGRDQFGAGNKFITPVVADGKVFVGTTNGVAVFGLLN
jgi:outer membrane protein assembly factor BamB